MHGKIHLFGLDTLVNLVVAARLHIELNVGKAVWSEPTINLRATQLQLPH